MMARGVGSKSTEEEILDAAVAVFVEKGYAGTRVQEIADRAGITQPLLHYYFRSKDNLYRKVLSLVSDDFFHHLVGAFSERSTFEETLKEFISSSIDYLAAHPHNASFMLHEMSQGSTIAAEVLKENLLGEGAALPQRMAALLEREHVAGRVRSADPVQLLLTLVGSCLWLFLAEPIVRGIFEIVQPDRNFDLPQFTEERKQAIFEVIHYGMKSRKD